MLIATLWPIRIRRSRHEYRDYGNNIAYHYYMRNGKPLCLAILFSVHIEKREVMTKTNLRNALKEQAHYLHSIRWSSKAIAYELGRSEQTIKRWLAT